MGDKTDAELREVRSRLEKLQRLGSNEAEPDDVSPSKDDWLFGGEGHTEEEAEMAELLKEAAPRLGLYSHRRLQVPHSHALQGLRGLPSREFNAHFKARIQRAVPVAAVPGAADWSRLTAVVSSEALAAAELELDSQPVTPRRSATESQQQRTPATPAGDLVEVNSGGRVLFCLFALPGQDEDTAPSTHQDPSTELPASEGGKGESPSQLVAAEEGILVLKFVPSRLARQSEQFANELACHVGVCAPDSWILRHKGPTEGEWGAALQAADRIAGRCPALRDEMARCSSVLVLEFLPGASLFDCPLAFQGAAALRTVESLGRLFALDMLLGNADRLPCASLGWRGNGANVMYSSMEGRWAGLPVAIDAAVQRRPPGGLLSAEDAACERLVELALHDGSYARQVLLEAVAASPAAVEAVGGSGSGEVVAAFQAGLRAGLGATAGLKGLLEMMFDRVSGWISAFVEDVESSYSITPHSASCHVSRRGTQSHAGGGGGGGGGLSARQDTVRIRDIQKEANRNQGLRELVARWQAAFREKSEELRDAVEEWGQARRGVGGAAAAAGRQGGLTTGFLAGTAPVVDLYELKVRLEHMLSRLRVLQHASATTRPSCLLPGLYLSGAVGASSMHLLRHLGVTHVLNATEDLLLPDDASAGLLGVLRIPLRDMEEEDISSHFDVASEFIDAALGGAGGGRGGVLVHCHAGKSRSCSLVLAWMMSRRRWTLRHALGVVQQCHPGVAPNAGYMRQLLELEEQLFGKQTLKVKNTKPSLKRCPECGDAVGLSSESVQIHLRLKHPTTAARHLAVAQ